MAFRQGIFRTNKLLNNYRKFSNMKFLETSLNDDSGVTTVTMKRPPVNSLNLEFLTEFSNVLTILKNEKSRGMILTSFSNKVFSAGLDIMEMYKPEEGRFKQFWLMLQEVWIQLYGSPFPTVAVINGHSPAGGCFLAMSCEYRVMVKNFTIGLNETQLGIAAPVWFIKTMLNTISKRNTELSLTSGRLYKTDEALGISMIDEIVSDKEEALKKAEIFFDQFEMVPPMARAYTKENLRGSDIEDLRKNREKDCQMTFSHVSQPQVQQNLEFYLALLKSKKDKSS